MGILEKIAEIEKEIARTQKNKGKMLFYHTNFVNKTTQPKSTFYENTFCIIFNNNRQLFLHSLM